MGKEEDKSANVLREFSKPGARKTIQHFTEYITLDPQQMVEETKTSLPYGKDQHTAIAMKDGTSVVLSVIQEDEQTLLYIISLSGNNAQHAQIIDDFKELFGNDERVFPWVTAEYQTVHAPKDMHVWKVSLAD